MFYMIYKITNQINGKIYIGSHKTKNLDDNYMGSGKYLKRAIEKNGIDNFKKEILHVYDNPESMYAKEAELVTEDFISTENTYNLKVGGFGGWDFINSKSLNGFSNTDTARKGRITANKKLEEKYGKDWRRIIPNNITPEKRQESIQKGLKTKKKNGYKSKTSQMNTPESIQKKKETYILTQHQKGSNNSNFGKMWITNGVVSKLILKTEDMPFGWSKGRVLN